MRSVQRILAIIEAFHADNPSLTLQEIANEVMLAKSTTFRVVKALEGAGYLLRFENQRYALSFKFVRLAGLAQSYIDVRTLVRPLLEKLARAAGESVTFATIEGQSRVRVAVVNSPSPLMSLNHSGESLPLGLGSASLVLLANLPPLKLDEYLGPTAKYAKCGRRELQSILRNVRRQGHAISHGGGIPGLSGISAPVRDPEGAATYCVSVVVPTARLRGRVPTLTALVKSAAADISERLGNDKLA